MWAWGVFPHQPVLHLQHYPPGASARSHELEGLVPQDCPHLQRQFQVPGATCTSARLALEVPSHPFLGSTLYQNNSQSSVKHFSYIYQYIIKNTNQEQPNERHTVSNDNTNNLVTSLTSLIQEKQPVEGSAGPPHKRGSPLLGGGQAQVL